MTTLCCECRYPGTGDRVGTLTFTFCLLAGDLGARGAFAGRGDEVEGEPLAAPAAPAAPLFVMFFSMERAAAASGVPVAPPGGRARGGASRLSRCATMRARASRARDPSGDVAAETRR